MTISLNITKCLVSWTGIYSNDSSIKLRATRVGPATVRALSLIGEIVYGSKASWQDPVKYNFAHGGKNGVPYPIARNIYDNSIRYLSSANEGAEIENDELKKLAEYSSKIFNTYERDEGKRDDLF